MGGIGTKLSLDLWFYLNTRVAALLQVHGDEDLPYNFIAGNEGIPSWDKRLEDLQEKFKACYMNHSPDFQVPIMKLSCAGDQDTLCKWKVATIARSVGDKMMWVQITSCCAHWQLYETKNWFLLVHDLFWGWLSSCVFEVAFLLVNCWIDYGICSVLLCYSVEGAVILPVILLWACVKLLRPDFQYLAQDVENIWFRTRGMLMTRALITTLLHVFTELRAKVFSVLPDHMPEPNQTSIRKTRL